MKPQDFTTSSMGYITVFVVTVCLRLLSACGLFAVREVMKVRQQLHKAPLNCVDTLWDAKRWCLSGVLDFICIVMIIHFFFKCDFYSTCGFYWTGIWVFELIGFLVVLAIKGGNLKFTKTNLRDRNDWYWNKR